MAGYPGGRRAAALLGDPRNDAQPRLMVLMFCWLGILATFAVQDVRGQNFSLVPGEVIDYVEAPDFWDVLFGNEVYISSPSITIMPNGDYIASHDFFDNGSNENQTRVFRSTNKGQSWTLQSTVTGAFQSTVFQHNGALYLFGPREGAGSNGDILIRQSTNNGVSWTNPTDATNGLLVDGDFGGTPNSPVIYNGRIWIGQSGRNVMSAPVGADLLLAGSWIRSNDANATNTPWGSGLTITEAQAVASPQSGVVIMPKVGEQPHSIIIRTTSNPAVVTSVAAPEDYIDLPGGEKKFGAGYDAVSGKYYILSNPVLPAHSGSGIALALIRNTAAMLSSKDLRHWDVEKIFLYSTHLDNGTWGEAFQYFNFAIDGDDLAVVSRTGFDVAAGQQKPPRGHDSNLMTFHVIEDFRSIGPTHTLVLDTAGNRVQRYETTQHADAPLGNFQLGTSFVGAPLNQPNGLAQDTNGDVYIREQGGRILRFDALGNFSNTVASLPAGLSFTGSPLAISQPAYGERSWVASGAGTWDELTNWYYWGRPDTNYEIATLGSAIPGNTTLTMNGSYKFKGVRFRNSSSYLIDGPGSITIEADAGHGVLDVQMGTHEIRNPVKLNSPTDWTVAPGASLRFLDSLDLNGQMLTVTGLGQRNIDGAFVMGGGKLITDGRNQITFSATTSATLDGTLQFMPYAGASLGLGASYDLLNGINFVADSFDQVLLPQLGGGLHWDTSSLYVTGLVTVAGMLGDYNGNGIVDAADYVLWRKGGPLLNEVDTPGTVNAADYAAWRARFGNTSGSGAGVGANAAVPEPASKVLLLFGMVASLTFRRGKPS